MQVLLFFVALEWAVVVAVVVVVVDVVPLRPNDEARQQQHLYFHVHPHH